MRNEPNQYSTTVAQSYSTEKRYRHPQLSLPYGTWINAVGTDLRGKKILDLACGSGFSSRLLASRGALVTGIDLSPDMIVVAREHEVHSPLGIVYHQGNCSEPLPIDDTQYDLVTAAFLFNYAPDQHTLQAMAFNAAHHLIPGGYLVGLTSAQNPIVPRLPHASHSSTWIDEPFIEGSRYELSLYDSEESLACQIACYWWSQHAHQNTLKDVGFTATEWIPLHVTPEIKSLPNWQELAENNCNIVFRTRKK